MLDSNLEPYKLIFYSGIKKVLICFAICLIISLFLNRFKKYKRRVLIVIFSAILVPSFVGFLKKETNMPCPKDRVEFGGIYPKTFLWEHYPKNLNLKKTRCYPAGHASGGFVLMSLYFLFRKKRYKKLGLIFGISLGWIMGIYKMLIGDHFFSHTFISMQIAWIIILSVTLGVYRWKLIKKYFYI